ncbi:GNAT family protein [uncultured Piscinibacter sp.]|uniref:GNAT family N-acetyltransferase n=1 Tax=uncultured Piscinibacter sp. TaxID=1131835 RepID=UPI002627C901|nr:GNAT family protein [uncultured Piscinibacter sp.]
MLAPEMSGFAVTPMVVADADDWVAYAALPESNEFVSSTVRSTADAVPLIERSLSGDPNSPLLFAIRELSSARLIASVGFHTVSSLNRTAEITYTVHPQLWGRGLATRACAAAVQWAFEHKGWARIQATTLERHHASQRVLAKCGFQLEGKLRNFRIVRGVPSDYLLFSVIPGTAASAA